MAIEHKNNNLQGLTEWFNAQLLQTQKKYNDAANELRLGFNAEASIEHVMAKATKPFLKNETEALPKNITEDVSIAVNNEIKTRQTVKEQNIISIRKEVRVRMDSIVGGAASTKEIVELLKQPTHYVTRNSFFIHDSDTQIADNLAKNSSMLPAFAEHVISSRDAESRHEIYMAFKPEVRQKVRDAVASVDVTGTVARDDMVQRIKGFVLKPKEQLNKFSLFSSRVPEVLEKIKLINTEISADPQQYLELVKGLLQAELARSIIKNSTYQKMVADIEKVLLSEDNKIQLTIKYYD